MLYSYFAIWRCSNIYLTLGGFTWGIPCSVCYPRGGDVNFDNNFVLELCDHSHTLQVVAITWLLSCHTPDIGTVVSEEFERK